MDSIKFCKFHGFGNDYIVFEADDLRAAGALSDFSERVCHRHTSIGGDGIAVLRKLDGVEADYSCEIVNPDGSIAGFSGNGTRCAVAYLYYKNLWSDENLKLKTRSGVKNYQFLKRDGDTFWFLAELGKPKFSSAEIPFAAADGEKPEITDHELRLANETVSITALNVGNPVAVIFVENFELDWRALGREIESHAQFPEKTNVVFVKTVDRNNIEIRIWERAAAETSSSGTCSIAAAVAAAFTGKTERRVSVHAVGGTTEAVWREDGEMMITGRADLAFCGEI